MWSSASGPGKGAAGAGASSASGSASGVSAGLSGAKAASLAVSAAGSSRAAGRRDDSDASGKAKGDAKAKGAKAVFFSVSLALLVCSRSLLVAVSRRSSPAEPGGEPGGGGGGRGFDYDPTSAVLMTEVFKLVLALGMLVVSRRSLGLRRIVDSLAAEVDWRVALLYAVPAALYAVQNNIVFYALLFVDPPTFELFSNLKIVTTAVAARIVMHRRLTSVQWVAVVLMAVGTALGQLGQREAASGGDGGGGGGGGGGDPAAPAIGAPLMGFALCVVYAVLSAGAGLFTERLLKGSSQSSHLQNVEIYVWSIAVNLAGSLLSGTNAESGGRDLADGGGGFFRGFTALTWVIVLNGALMGQSVSFVMLYADNIVKTFAACVALFMSTLLSIIFAGFEPTGVLIAGFAVCSCALYLYFGAHNAVLAASDTSQHPLRAAGAPRKHVV